MARTIKNEPAKAGKRAAKARFFGGNSRFAVYPVHTRFDAVKWFVSDAEVIDEATGLASVIRQEPTDAAAEAVWSIVESRQPTTRPDDGTVTITTTRAAARLAGSILAGSHGEWPWFGSVYVGPGANDRQQATAEELEAVSAFVKQLEES